MIFFWEFFAKPLLYGSILAGIVYTGYCIPKISIALVMLVGIWLVGSLICAIFD